ncbi:MAG: hypothetical protein AB7D37_16600 [Desulfovibrio sp.]
MIDLNATFFVQFVNFLLILILLNVILIGPIRRMLKKRADFIASQVDGIDSFTASADTKLKDYEAALDAARQAATAQRVAMKDEGLAREKDVLDAAAAEAAATMKAARGDIAVQTETAQKTLSTKISGLASKAVAKVLAA